MKVLRWALNGLLMALPDFGDWNYYLRLVDEYAELGEIEDIKQDVLAAIEYLRSIFGEKWPTLESLKGHPLLRGGRLSGISRWQRLWLIDFAKSVRELLNRGFGPDIISRLSSSKHYLDAEAEVIFAGQLLDLGIDVYPAEMIQGKKADLRIVLEDSEVYVEVSNIRESSEEKWAMDTFDEIINHELKLLAKFPDIGFGGKIFRSLSKPHLAVAKREISQAFDRATREVVVKIREEGVYEFDIYQTSVRGQEPTLRGNLQGPDFDPSGPARIVTKIRKEVEQIPKNGPGLLVLFDQNLLLWGLAEDSWRHVAARFCESVYEYSWLVGAIATRSYSGQGTSREVEENAECTVVRRTRYENLQEETILVPNRFGSYFPLGTRFFQRIASSNP